MAVANPPSLSASQVTRFPHNSRREFTDCEGDRSREYSGCRGRCQHLTRKQIGQNGPDSPRYRERSAKGQASTDPLQPPATERVEPSGNFQDPRSGAGSKKSRTRRFSRHSRQDPSSTAQRAPGSLKTSPALLTSRRHLVRHALAVTGSSRKYVIISVLFAGTAPSWRRSVVTWPR